MELSTLIYFILSSMLLTITPGPDIICVMTQSISQGKKSGIALAFGLATGLIVHTAAAAFGVSAIIRQSVLAFSILKYAGAIYLFYLAFKAFKESDSLNIAVNESTKSVAHLYRQGILMNILNPKVIIFFLAFLPQFVKQSSGNIAGQIIVLGILFMLQTILIFGTVAIFAGTLGEHLLSNQKFAKYIRYIKSGVFAVIGISLIFSSI